MARYIDADALAKNGWHLERSGISNVTLQTMSLADVPTADVVPKSEVEEVVEKFMSATDKVICEAKQEVAREIFEEIEKLILRYYNDEWYTVPDLGCDVEILKKKYAEEKE